MRVLLMALMTIGLLAAPSRAHDRRGGGKLLLTNGVATVEGASGGGISTWALIAGNETRDGIGLSAHVSVAVLPDFGWESHGFAIGLFDRVEASYARQNLDTRTVGARLGIGRGHVLDQDVFGVKVRLLGDAVYGSPYLPQVSIGAQHKRNRDGAIARAVGARRTDGTDLYVAATKLLLRHSVLLGATVRLTEANQTGLLGFGGDVRGGRRAQVEGTVGYQLSPRFVVGGEYRSKPDALRFAREDDWRSAYLAFAVTRNLTATAAWVDLGRIATTRPQRGAFFSLQASI